MPADLRLIFKAYDVRGVYPDQFDEDAAFRIGRAFAAWTRSDRILLGRDCRTSSPALSSAFTDGVTSSGTGVVDMGLATTDLLYFASGRMSLPGAMFTASHNPPQYNGLKLCLSGAAPVGEDTGLQDVRRLADQDTGSRAASTGSREEADLLDDYLEHVLSFADVAALSPLVVAADAANGMAGLVLPPLFERLPFKFVPLYMELDGSFPNHPADPIVPENQEDVKRAVLENGADLGLAFDGDADRVFFVDEDAQGISGSLITALVAIGMLERYPGATILHNVICSRVVPEVIREHGGEPVRTRVGHSFVKKVMADTGAVFGGEHSGHYYFRDHYRADSGVVAAVVVLDQMSKSGKSLSELLEPLRRYRDSGEVNSKVADPPGTIEKIAEAYSSEQQNRLDGLTVESDDWWFNVRPSNTEPLLRLNVEATTDELLRQRVDEVLSLIRE